jgi:hypothetical protein
LTEFIFISIEWHWDANLGNCYRINSGMSRLGRSIPVESVYDTGVNHGLSLSIFDRLEDNDFVRISNIEQSIGPSIVIYNQSQFQIANSLDSIKLKAGTCTNIRIKKVQTSTMPQPYSNCHDLNAFHSDLFHEMRKLNFTYRQKNCIDLCKNDYIISKCKCNSPFLPNVRNVKPCYTKAEYICSYDFLKDINKKVRSICYDMCPIECDSVEYERFISYEEWPSLGYYEQLSRNPLIVQLFTSANKTIDYKSVRASMYCLNIFYEQLTFTEISEVPSITVLDVVSNIGGTIGKLFFTTINKNYVIS